MNPISCSIPAVPPAYQLDILGALTQTGITQTAAGGKARAFCDIVGDQLGTMETNEFLNLGQTLISFTTLPSTTSSLSARSSASAAWSVARSRSPVASP